MSYHQTTVVFEEWRCDVCGRTVTKHRSPENPRGTWDDVKAHVVYESEPEVDLAEVSLACGKEIACCETCARTVRALVPVANNPALKGDCR